MKTEGLRENELPPSCSDVETSLHFFVSCKINNTRPICYENGLNAVLHI